MHQFTRHLTPAATASALAAMVTLATATARAQSIVKNPGDHPKYAVELEPHGLLDWDGYFWGGTGFGLGMHAVIPFLDNGPVSTINNNMGIGFGLDWSHFDNSGCGFYLNGRPGLIINGNVCDASENVLRFPIYVQWNFFLTKVVSVFGEAGFGIDHSWYSFNENVVCPAGGYCGSNHTGAFPYFEGGGRFLFGDTAGILVRIGYPFLTVGAAILL
jgi:hypothetical protein